MSDGKACLAPYYRRWRVEAETLPSERIMSVENNKQVVHDFFAALSNGDTEGASALRHEDLRWTIIGDTPVSKTYSGRQAATEELMSEVLNVIDDE